MVVASVRLAPTRVPTSVAPGRRFRDCHRQARNLVVDRGANGGRADYVRYRPAHASALKHRVPAQGGLLCNPARRCTRVLLGIDPLPGTLPDVLVSHAE